MPELHVAATPELRLLFQRDDAPPSAASEHPAIDWVHLFDMAERANSFPVIWRRLSKGADLEIPGSVAQQMRRRAMVAEFSLLMQGRLLEQALGTLASVGIDAVLLKGAALAASVYGSFANRPMGDIDLLVPSSDAKRARDALVEDGWVWHRDPALDSFYEEHCHLPPLYDAGRTGTSLELHTDLFVRGHPFEFSAADIWRDRQRARVGTRMTWVPSPEHLLLHAVIHFAWSHGMSGGAWNTFRDVDALAKRVDWPTFTDLANRAGARSCAYWTFSLARALGAAAVPDVALDSVRVEMPGVLRRILLRHVLTGLVTPEAQCPSRRVQRRLWELAIRPSASGHGSARPWMRDDRYTPTESVEETAEAIAEASGRAVRVPTWRKYLRAMVRPR